MTRTTVLLLAAVVLLSSVPVAVTADSTQPVTLTISVVDRTGNPVADATVQATWDGGSTTETTRSNGKTLIDVPSGARVELNVTSDQYIRNTNYVIRHASSGDVQVTVAEKGSATVTATNNQGQTITDAHVRMWQDGTRVVDARTNAKGVYKTDAIEQGEYQLFVFKEGYLRNSTRLQVDGDVSQSLSIEQGSVTATFRVTDDHFESPRPLENASIDVKGVASGVQTLGNGENTLSVPVNDVYDVTVTKSGYQTATERLRVNEDATSLNVSIQRTPAISIDSLSDRIVVGENVSIDVTDEYGTPVANASVTVDGASVGETDADGALTFGIDTAGNHTVEATAGDLTDTATIEGIDPDAKQTTTQSQQTAGTTSGESNGSGPGFTPLVALAAVLLAAAMLARR